MDNTKNPGCSDTAIETNCIHLKDEAESFANYGAISFPIYQTSTFAHRALGQGTGYDYSRLQNPTRERLEKIVASIEHGTDAIALSTGMAAISMVMELFVPGDHLIIDSDLYGGSIRLFQSISVKNGLSFSLINSSQEPAEPYINEHTRGIFIESPTNPMMRVCDIEALARLSRKHGLLLIVDNTFLSPYFQNPLDLGADIVVHSGTKYLSGHNDTLSGFVVTARDDLSDRLRFLTKTIGATLAPFDCWLMMRGISTLPIRMERAQANAMALAAWLREQPAVTSVLYPGLKEHPGHELMTKQARGFGAMITFKVRDEAFARKLLGRVRLIRFAESLGGVETLITYPSTQTHADVPEEVRLRNGLTPETLRLSVGIENIKDLIAELDRVFRSIDAEACQA